MTMLNISSTINYQAKVKTNGKISQYWSKNKLFTMKTSNEYTSSFKQFSNNRRRKLRTSIWPTSSITQQSEGVTWKSEGGPYNTVKGQGFWTLKEKTNNYWLQHKTVQITPCRYKCVNGLTQTIKVIYHTLTTITLKLP